SSGSEIVACQICQPGDDRVVECDIDIVSSSSDQPTREAGEYRSRSVMACRNIRHRDTHSDRRPTLLTSPTHATAHRERRDLVPGPVPVGTRLAEARDGAVDKRFV